MREIYIFIEREGEGRERKKNIFRQIGRKRDKDREREGERGDRDTCRLNLSMMLRAS